MLVRLPRAPWRGGQRSRGAVGRRRLACTVAPPAWAPLAHTLTAAAQQRLSAHHAQTLCASVVQDTLLHRERAHAGATLAHDSAHARLLHAVLMMKTGSVHRDVLLSELLGAMWTADAQLPDELLAHVAARAGVHGLQRTRARLHRYLVAQTKPHDSTRVWRALLDAHALRHDWARVAHGLAVCAARTPPVPVDAYRYAFLRLQHESPHKLPAAMHRVLQQMQRDERMLDDTLLAELVYALGAPVRHAQASGVRGAALVRTAASVHTMLDGLFDWLCAAGEAHCAQYRMSLSTLLHVQLDTIEALYHAQTHRARALHVPARHTGAMRRRVQAVRSALRGDDGLLDSLEIRLDGICGEMDTALAHLTAWLAASTPSAALARRQRRTVLALFATASRRPRAERLMALLQLLRIATVYGSAARLWHGVAGRTLPRLWARLLALWAQDKQPRTAAPDAAHTGAGWPFLVLALPVLAEAMQRTPHLPHRTWAAVVDDPHRCRAMVWAACSALPREAAPARMRELTDYFTRLHAPARVHRWACATEHDATARLLQRP
ncbi:hypothetical protein MBRA1_001317 [Malassezia brasiliensis]|uniref:Uncharacterized protein n=1 Tax=Malassezia brasiliensis TaxID=1821822 RepID=A0AAF0IS86_9BASI|nr:hypothetical protein MBRA1_001317 [Malassezia brasiliensis]